MTEYVAAGTLRAARELYTFVNDEALPGTDITPEKFWAGLDEIVRDLAPKNRALLEKRDRLQAEIDAWHRERRGRHFELGRVQGVPAEDRLPAAGRAGLFRHHRECRSGDRRDRRAAARRAGDECALRAERRQCALGQPLRCALRHRRDLRRGRRRARQGIQPRARSEGHRFRARLSRRGGAARRRIWPRSERLPRRAARPRRRARQLARRRARAHPASSSGFDGSRTRRHRRSCSGTTTCTSRSASIRRHPIGRNDPAGIADVWSKRRSRRSWTWRIRSPRSTPRTRSWPTATGSA